MDPVCEMDLNLDIGGRTSEIAHEILRSEGIAVENTETGGFFACRLSLNLQTWETRIEPSDHIPPFSERTECVSLSLNTLDAAIKSARPIPQVALEIIRMVSDSDRYGLRDVAHKVRKDQVLSAKVLRLCNSASFGLRKKLDSIDQALIMLGEKQLFRLAVSIALEKFFSNSIRGYSLCKGGLYHHAVGTATIAERLSTVTGKGSPGVAYTAGLLHDIGKVVLDQSVVPVLPFFYRRIYSDGVALIQVEHDVFGIDHTEVGGRLANHWSLSENLIDSIRYHHQPDLETGEFGLKHLIYISDLIMSRFKIGLELDRLDGEGLQTLLKAAGINQALFCDVIDNIPLEQSIDPGVQNRNRLH